jgi:hypothetical protein
MILAKPSIVQGKANEKVHLAGTQQLAGVDYIWG